MGDLTPGRIYFIESDAGDNQNWKDDPDDIVIGNFTEGIDFCQIEIPDGFTIMGFTGAIVTPSGSGKSFADRIARRFYQALSQGISTSIANANLIDKFFLSNRHVSGASDVYVDYYMIVYFGTDLHMGFIDANNTQQSYCKGIAENVIRQWNQSDSLNINVKIKWDSEW